VVNACDAGREGELIFRYVYEWAGSRLPVRRLWISSLTDEAIRSGFAALKPGSAYDALGDAARCRSEADWLVGLNATRAVTLRLTAAARAAERARGTTAQPSSKAGKPPLYSIGRVQTPTLAIVVRRDEAIAAFRPEDYWEVKGTFRGTDEGSAAFTAGWFIKKATDKGTTTRFQARAIADQVVARAQRHGRAAEPSGPVVERLAQRQSREAPPALFDLTSLQRTANRRFGMSASATLEAAQALYERHKILTYPRTDARHLSRDLIEELPRLFRGLEKHAPYAAFVRPLRELVDDARDGSPFRGLKRVFDDTKVHDHHAIIPTGKRPGAGLSRDEQRIFDLVVRRFLGAFHPDAEFATTEAIVRVGDAGPLQTGTGPTVRVASSKQPAGASRDDDPEKEPRLQVLPPPPDRFVARGRVRLVAGWQAVAGWDESPRKGRGERPDGEGAELEATLPALEVGQRLSGTFATVARQTRPPPHHSEATLLGAMESAGKEIEDEELRAAMKDTGLGTPATRASTIETLVKRGFIARKDKQVLATPTGIDLIRRLPVPTLASPELTGAWEARLARIARGEDGRGAFMKDIVRYVEETTATLRDMDASSAAAASAPARAEPPGALARPAVAAEGRTLPVPAPQTRPGSARAKLPARKRARAGASDTKKMASAAWPCPRCKQGTLMAGRRGWGCSRWREGCAFVIWFEAGGRPITAAQLQDLLEKGRTRKTKWTPPGAAAVTGHLILDVNGPRERGGVRFEPLGGAP